MNRYPTFHTRCKTLTQPRSMAVKHLFGITFLLLETQSHFPLNFSPPSICGVTILPLSFPGGRVKSLHTMSGNSSRDSIRTTDEDDDDFEPILPAGCGGEGGEADHVGKAAAHTALAEDHDSLLRYFLKLFYPETESRMAAARAKAAAAASSSTPSTSLSHGFNTMLSSLKGSGRNYEGYTRLEPESTGGRQVLRTVVSNLLVFPHRSILKYRSFWTHTLQSRGRPSPTLSSARPRTMPSTAWLPPSPSPKRGGGSG